jgi:predicted TPR repeat methyltransferase
VPFHEVGLRIYGVDGSREILDVCEAKGFAGELLLHDLRDLPLPYENARFDHVIAVGVLNSFPDLAPFVAEAARLIRGNGVFAFTVEDQKPGQERSWAVNRAEVDDLPDHETAVRLYRHSRDEIVRLLEQSGFSLMASEDFVGFRYPAENRNVIFTAYLARR